MTDENHEYRIEQLEKAVTSLANAHEDVKTFVTEIKVWMRVIAYILGILAIVLASLFAKLILG